MVKPFFLTVLSALALIGCAATPIPPPSLPATRTLFPTLSVPPSPTVQPARPTTISVATPEDTPTNTAPLDPTATALPTTIPTVAATAPLTPSNLTPQPMEGLALIRALQRGGCIIVFRHAITDQSQSDTVPQVLEDCAKQRNLSEQGRTQAREIGSAIAKLKIPIGVVLSSPYCRTRETAMLAFGRAQVTPKLDNAFINTDRRPELQAALKQLAAEPPAAGTNTVLVTHGDNMTRALGVSVAEGEAAIVMPDGAGGFAVIGRVSSSQWGEFAAPQ